MHRIGVEDDTLRGVPLYNVIHAANDQACVIAGAMWMRGGAGDYWIGLPFIGVYGSADGKLVTIDLFPENGLDVAVAYFNGLTPLRMPTSAERWMQETTEMINARRVDQFAERVAEGFTEDSRRTGFSFVIDRDEFVTGLHVFAEQDLSLRNLGVVATAGDLAGLRRCETTGTTPCPHFCRLPCSTPMATSRG